MTLARVFKIFSHRQTSRQTDTHTHTGPITLPLRKRGVINSYHRLHTTIYRLSSCIQKSHWHVGSQYRLSYAVAKGLLPVFFSSSSRLSTSFRCSRSCKALSGRILGLCSSVYATSHRVRTCRILLITAAYIKIHLVVCQNI